MVQRTVALHYHMDDGETFHHTEKMQQFLESVVNQGYRLCTLEERDQAVHAQRMALLEAHEGAKAQTLPPFEAGISPGFQDSLSMFLHRRQTVLFCWAFLVEYNPWSNFSFSIIFDTEAATALVSLYIVNIAFARDETESHQVFATWLDLFLALYHGWSPLYGHSWSPELHWPEPSDEVLQAGRIPDLYDINFWGKNIVEKIGREHILSMPAWKVRLFADGGALIIPTFPLTRRDPEARRRVEQHIGTEQSFWGKYVPQIKIHGSI